VHSAQLRLEWPLTSLLSGENNEYGMGTPVSRSSSNKNFYTRGNDIPGILVHFCVVIASSFSDESL
jgi:pyruvate dehydrogenase E1 component alpha subunit